MISHTACIYLPKEIFGSFESLSLRELSLQILLDLELDHMTKNDAVLRDPLV